MDLGMAVGFMAAGGLIVWGLWMLSEHLDPRERVNFKDLKVSQIDRFFEALVSQRERAVMSVTHPPRTEDPGAISVPVPQPAEPDLVDWDQAIEPPAAYIDSDKFRPRDPREGFATPDMPNILPGAEPDISQVIVGAARAWRQGMPGAEVTLTHWVDVLEENLNRPEAVGHLRPEAQHHPIGSATSEP